MQTEHEQIQMYKSLRNSFLVESTQTSCCHNLISQKQKNLSKTRFRKALNLGNSLCSDIPDFEIYKFKSVLSKKK